MSISPIRHGEIIKRTVPIINAGNTYLLLFVDSINESQIKLLLDNHDEAKKIAKTFLYKRASLKKRGEASRF